MFVPFNYNLKAKTDMITELQIGSYIVQYSALGSVIHDMWEHGWHSGESARLPPMWPGFNSGPVSYSMWVEFVVSSRP